MEISLLQPHILRVHGKGVTLGLGDGNPKLDVFFSTKLGAEISHAQRGFSRPGEYEVQGVMVDGVQSGENAVSYHVTAEGNMLAAVSVKSPADLTDAMLEVLQPAQMLALWVAEGSAADIAQLVARCDVQKIIPVDIPVEMDELAKVLQLTPEKSDKLKVTNKELAEGAQVLYQLLMHAE